jgi:hypothetical protein
MRGVFRPDAIANGMQRGAQHLVGKVAILCAQPLHELLEPEIGLLQGRIEDIEAGCHDRLLASWNAILKGDAALKHRACH